MEKVKNLHWENMIEKVTEKSIDPTKGKRGAQGDEEDELELELDYEDKLDYEDELDYEDDFEL